MKKLISFLACMVVIISCLTTVHSESSKLVDFSNLSSISEEDLIEYDNLLEAEKARRGLFTTLPEGEFLVGKDIAPGRYNIKYYPNKNIGEFDFTLVIKIFTSKEAFDKQYSKDSIPDSLLLKESFSKKGEYEFNLEEGQLFYVWGSQVNGQTFVQKTNGLFMD